MTKTCGVRLLLALEVRLALLEEGHAALGRILARTGSALALGLGKEDLRQIALERGGEPVGIAFAPHLAVGDDVEPGAFLVADGGQVRRRREGLSCNERFTTFETAELVMPRLVKSDGTRQPFDEAKLRAGMLRALEKRPVSMEDLEAAISRVCHRLRATGERELPARELGEFVMEELQQLDDVAYVRFASVYRNFREAKDFQDVLGELKGKED